MNKIITNQQKIDKNDKDNTIEHESFGNPFMPGDSSGSSSSSSSWSSCSGCILIILLIILKSGLLSMKGGTYEFDD